MIKFVDHANLKTVLIGLMIIAVLARKDISYKMEYVRNKILFSALIDNDKS